MLRKLMLLLATLGLFAAIPAVTVVEGYSFPSTNDDNRDNGHPHVNQVDVGAGEVTLEFVNDTNSLAVFEYRIDGQVLTSGSPTR